MDLNCYVARDAVVRAAPILSERDVARVKEALAGNRERLKARVGAWLVIVGDGGLVGRARIMGEEEFRRKYKAMVEVLKPLMNADGAG